MPARALPYRPHNHDHCIDQALAEARDICRRREARLTPARERVLELVWQSHKPLGAYEVLAQLAAGGHNSAPPTVYRALDFLQQHGLVHRIASLNAFIGCAHPGQNHCGTFLICHRCGNVLELTAAPITHAIHQAAAVEAFHVEQVTLEIAGLCPRCQTGADAAREQAAQ